MENREQIDCLLKSFEVYKRIYNDYDWDTWKPVTESGYRDFKSYIKFAELLLEVFHISHCFKYLSCLLKLNDTLLSLQQQLEPRQKRDLSKILENELQEIELLLKRYHIEKK